MNPSPTDDLNKHLDASQYTRESIKKYERIYGHNFISPGGLDSTREIVQLLQLQPGMTVLDVGSGIGGAAFYMAQEYGVRIHGVDFSRNMVALAQERLQDLSLDALVTFAHGDILDTVFDEAFDVIYSRDAFLHIHEKARLFQILYRALKPHGLLFFTDYCRGEGETSEEFLAYVAERGYDLHTPHAYGKLLKQAGFTDVVALDKTTLFGEYLRLEFERMPDDGTMTEIWRLWEEKIARNARGEQGWGWFWGRRGIQMTNKKRL